MHYWQHGGLPNDDRKLQRIARMSGPDWDDTRETLAEFFDSEWHHKRIDAELAKADDVINKRRAAGKAGASARYGKQGGNGIANANELPSQTHSHPHTPNVPNGTDEPSDQDWLFDEGAKILMAGGSTEKQAKGMIGKWRKDGATDAAIRQALTDAANNGAAEPTAYATKILKRPPKRDPTVPVERNRPPVTESDWRDRVTKWRLNGFWPNAYGPRPDMQSTEVPPEIRKEFGI